MISDFNFDKDKDFGNLCYPGKNVSYKLKLCCKKRAKQPKFHLSNLKIDILISQTLKESLTKTATECVEECPNGALVLKIWMRKDE